MNRRTTMIIVVALLLVGAFVRFAELGRSPFRADTVEFYKQALADKSIVELWKNPPWYNQIPVAESINLLFHQLTGLQPTPFTVRLPFALMGWATLLLLWLWARKTVGDRVALWVLLWGAINPFHAYISRESYHYVGVAFWATMMLMAYVPLWRAAREETAPTIKQWALWFLASFAACYSHMSVWSIFAAQWLILAVEFLKRRSENTPALKQRWGGLIAVGAVLALTLSRWIYRALTGFLPNAEVTWKHSRDWSHFTDIVASVWPGYLFGAWWLGLVLMAALIALGVFAYLRADDRPLIRRLLLLTAAEFVLLTLVMAWVGKGQGSRTYYAAIWPLAMLLAGWAVHTGLERGLGGAKRTVCAAGMAAGLVLYFAFPVQAVIRLDGKPTPYFKLVRWLDTQLPPNTPVLVDRWFEPWNEMRLYASTNVFVTFTYPDEPLDNFIKYKWRTTARDFFEKYPEAAFLELTKNHWNQPGIGPWEWPRRHFEQHAVIRNEPGLLLRKWGLAPRGGFYAANTNRLVAEIFYNTREDIVENARKAGRSDLLLYGADWKNLKPFWQKGDFTHWRVMEQSARFDVYNFTEAPVQRQLVLEGVGWQGDKTVTTGAGQAARFPANKLGRIALGPVALPSGASTIVLSDPNWNAARIPLLIRQAELVAPGP